MAKIKYIGKKPRKTDNVARTGAVWNGAGDVQEVPDGAVGKLLAHPEVWELVDGNRRPIATGGTTNEPGTGKDTGNEMETEAVDVSDNPPLVDLNAMDAQALREYAQRHFGHAFHHKTGEQKMRDTIIGLMNRGG